MGVQRAWCHIVWMTEGMQQSEEVVQPVYKNMRIIWKKKKGLMPGGCRWVICGEAFSPTFSATYFIIYFWLLRSLSGGPHLTCPSTTPKSRKLGIALRKISRAARANKVSATPIWKSFARPLLSHARIKFQRLSEFYCFRISEM